MEQFDEIRPFNDQELKEALKELVNDSKFIAVFARLYPQPELQKKIQEKMSQITTVDSFQGDIIMPLLDQIEKSSTQGLSFSTMEMFKPDQNYLFISNHRDIILDPAFLNAIMHKNGFKKTEIAIGNNLLIFPWIERLVRINRAFIVKRGVGIREQLTASRTLSEYIRYAVTQKGESVWIAQREGRSKDGNDQTQPALLKMLNMSNSSDVVSGFKNLNIVPMAISYEIEPCGISKVIELLKRKYNPDFVKTQQDDLKSMVNGMMMPKGRVHFGFGNPLNVRIDEVTADLPENGKIAALAQFIDKRIYYNYKRWPNNYLATDLLRKESRYENRYSDQEKTIFIDRMEKDLSTLSGFSMEEAREMYLKMYANPVLNFEKYFG